MGKMKSVGGLWVKTSKKNGKKFMTGLDLKVLQGLDPDQYNLLIFKNEKKDNDKQPDYNVVAVEQDGEFKKKSTYAPQVEKKEEDFGF